MIYGHFDVQPPSPLELWETPPFELAERDGWYYARGIADDKGQLFTLLKAAQLLREQNALPVNIRIVSDGEEEIGGHSVVDFLEADERGADVCIIFDGGMTRPEQPEFGARHARPRRVSAQGEDRRPRHALRLLRRRCAQRDPRADAGALRGRRRGTDCCRTRSASAARRCRSSRSTASRACRRARRSSTKRARRRSTRRRPSDFYDPDLGRALARRERHPAAASPSFVNTTLIVEAAARFTVRLAPGQDPERIAAAVEKLIRAAVPDDA